VKPRNSRNRGIQAPRAPNEHEIDFNPKATRAQGGKGLLSHENSVQGLHKSMAKILPRREEGGRTERRREEEGRLALEQKGRLLSLVECPGNQKKKRKKTQGRSSSSLPCSSSSLTFSKV